MGLGHMLMQFPALHMHNALNEVINHFVNWFTVKAAGETNFVSRYLGDFLVWLEHLLERLPWPLVVGGAGAIGWRVGGARLGIGVALGLFLMGALGYWKDGMDTLALVGVATAVCIVVGIPLGILMARSPAVRGVLNPILDVMQTMPSFVYLIPALMFFGLGAMPALVATFIYAVPPVMRLTDLGIRQVSREAVEAGISFGSTPSQLLFKVQMPMALRTIMAGVNQTIMMALAMVVVASMIGAGGLGDDVLQAISQMVVGQGVLAGLSIVILAIVIDRITQKTVRTRAAAAR